MTKSVAREPRRPRGPRSGGKEAPLSAEEIVAAGVRITASLGLAGWSTRDLADEVGCWPTAIVHRVGGRHEVERAIVESILRTVELPDAQLSWRPWYQQLLASLRATLARYPGVARWLGIAATTAPAAVQIIDAGVEKLAAAGLGDEAPLAHILLLNTVVYLIASEDDREIDPRLEATIVASLRGMSEDESRPGAARFAGVLSGSLDREQVYAYAVDRALDGIEVRIAAGQAAGLPFPKLG